MPNVKRKVNIWFDKEKLMQIVIDKVEIAIKEGNAPFAAVLVDKEGNIIEKAHNTTKTNCNPTMHAEINLITKACQKLKTMDLSDYYIISNAWSCSMCASACIKAKIKNYIYGSPSEPNMNPNITIFDIKEKTKTDFNIEIDVLKEKCQNQIRNARNAKREDTYGKYNLSKLWNAY